MNKWTLFFGAILCFEAHAAMSASFAAMQTQNKLHQLDTQIRTLQQTLNSETNKRNLLTKELSITEQQINEGMNQLRTLQNDMHHQEQKIATLEHQIQQLNNQFSIQQHQLAKQIRLRYQMGISPPVQWLFHHDNLHQSSRLFNYYHYIIHSQRHDIERIQETHLRIDEHKTALHKELTTAQQLKNKLTDYQKKLNQKKQHHTVLIRSLTHNIQEQQNSLHEAQKNKADLALILKSLSHQHVMQMSRPFSQMRKHLPFPVQAQRRSLRKMNQGVTFFAEEGAAVTAIYPGKVVFSDWLRGYGLLLIIDHGQGFMSLYAHNQALFKNKGQYVRQNEPIASVGHSGGIKQNGLYFEIRLRGKAISPQNWLVS